MSGSRESWIEAHGLGQGFQRFLGMFAPGELREVVMSERIIRVLLNVGGEFLRPFRHVAFRCTRRQRPGRAAPASSPGLSRR